MVSLNKKRVRADLYQKFDVHPRYLECQGRQRLTLYVDPALARELENKWAEVLWDATNRDDVEPPLKNRDFHPAVIRAAVSGTTVEEELGL